MHRFNAVFAGTVGVTILLGLRAVAVAQGPEQNLPDPASGYQWRDADLRSGNSMPKR